MPVDERRSQDSAAPRAARVPLRLAIVLLFLLMLAVIAIILGATVGKSSRKLVDSTVSASFAGSAALSLQTIERMEGTARAAAAALAASPMVSAAPDQRRGHLAGLGLLLRAMPGVSAAYVGWPDGDFVLLRPVNRIVRGLGAPDGADWLAQWADSSGGRFEFLDARMHLIETRMPPGYLFDPRRRPWFREAQAGTDTIVTAPYIFFTTREPGISAARRANSGAVAGVDLSLWDLSESLPRGTPVPSVQAAIVDAAGGVLAHSDTRRLQSLVGTPSADFDPNSVERLPELPALGTPVLAALAAMPAARASGFSGTLQVDGREWLGRAVPRDDGKTLFLMAAAADELGEGAAEVRGEMLGTLGWLLLLAVPVVWLAARLLARPVERFADEVDRIARLDFGPTSPVASRIDELGRLESAIESMRAALRERIKELGCLYRVQAAIADPARPLDEVCDEIATALAAGLLHAPEGMARVAVEGVDCRGPGWAVPSASMKATISGLKGSAGFIELGYSRPMPSAPGGEGPFLPEERVLLDTVASLVERMLESRRTANELMRSERLRAVGQLTGGVAHDFNNLLTVILGNSELLRERLAGDRELEGLAAITQTAAERGAELTRQLLAFSRRQVLDPHVVDVGERLLAMEPMLRRTLPRNIDLRIERTEGPLAARIDPVQLEVAILNLAINARDAMPDGGCLTIETGNAIVDEGEQPGPEPIDSGRYVAVTVSDTGTGMSAEVVAKAFEPFFTTKEPGKGSGLGLSMVYGFVRQSGGHVRIYSEPGRGTAIRLYLPAADGPVSDTGESAESSPLERGHERILLVEDDDLVRGHVRTQLESLGYRVVEASNGRQAIALLERDSDFDLLFTDLIMPGGLNGRQLADELARRWPSLRVLFTSGFPQHAAGHQGLLEPGMLLLHKPYRRAELAARLREALLRPSVRSSA